MTLGRRSGARRAGPHCFGVEGPRGPPAGLGQHLVGEPREIGQGAGPGALGGVDRLPDLETPLGTGDHVGHTHYVTHYCTPLVTRSGSDHEGLVWAALEPAPCWRVVPQREGIAGWPHRSRPRARRGAGRASSEDGSPPRSRPPSTPRPSGGGSARRARRARHARRAGGGGPGAGPSERRRERGPSDAGRHRRVPTPTLRARHGTEPGGGPGRRSRRRRDRHRVVPDRSPRRWSGTWSPWGRRRPRERSGDSGARSEGRT